MRTSWWRNAVIYQIYPKSFQDSTGNGSGDLSGITRRLDYLRLLGVDALWLTPIYISPQVDSGYDIADYYAIDPAYGTMADFEALVAGAHRRGMRIIMDMVLNHTSTSHPWFIASKDPHGPYRRYYFWRDGQGDGPPNNWLSKFGGSAWHQPEPGGQYYLHLYSREQADLNWDHPPLREELKNICRFWAGRGIDGLRLDVINVIAKHPQLPDAPEGDGRPFYTDLPRAQDYLREMNREIFTPLGLMTVGEMSSTSLEKCRHYANIDGEQLSMAAHFHHLKVDYAGGEKWAPAMPDFVLLKQIFNRWQRGMHHRAWNTLFWCNHDQPRIVSRFGDEGELRVASAKMLAMALHGMQGTPFIFQGEELGMTNPGFAAIEEYRDIESLNMYADATARGIAREQTLGVLAARSRDNSRTPMQWDNGVNAGFSSGTPWIACAGNADRINAQAALADADSIFYCYQQLIGLRKTLAILTEGDYRDLCPAHPALWHYRRAWRGQRLLVLANLSRQPQQWRPAIARGGPWRRLISNYGDTPHAPQPLTLRPYEAVYWLRG
ncbi:alpha,alpha-phosphotrehalase [Acerihabitans arboris]|uniref:Alpha,alpha-phosphotrehalase n=1 Tax=Acerihabitans arboris TaxID=2691583 RepID=A0A845SR49_9GAMM|nr:alpha,alpha-phosphotrehalase [Acerihabitans arboris]NDL65098.1 alpha,alpha-phosphotrehalase [Acerihabitans arboris]